MGKLGRAREAARLGSGKDRKGSRAGIDRPRPRRAAATAFDLDAAVAASPPYTGSALTNPRVREWFDRLVAMNDRVSHAYVAGILTLGARTEGIIGPDDHVSVETVRRHRNKR